MNPRFWIACGGIVGALGVSLGAFGAHGLEDRLAALGFSSEEILRRGELFATAARYQMYHAPMIVVAGLLLSWGRSRIAAAAGWCYLGGVAIFSGLLYAMVFASRAYDWLGAIVPIGGTLLIAGWILLAASARAAPFRNERL